MGYTQKEKSKLNETLVAGVIEVFVAFRPSYLHRGREFCGSMVVVVDINDFLVEKSFTYKVYKKEHSVRYPYRFSVFLPFLIENLTARKIVPYKHLEHLKDFFIVIYTNDPILYMVFNGSLSIPTISDPSFRMFLKPLMETISKLRKDFGAVFVKSRRGWGKRINAFLKKDIRALDPKERIRRLRNIKLTNP